MADQWSDIAPSPNSKTLHLRRADPKHPLDVFRGRDHLGRPVFSYQGSFGPAQPRELPSMAFVEVELVHREGMASELLIRLLDQSNVDTFRALCENLCASTEQLNQGDDAQGLAIILMRLHRWQDLLRSKRERRLSHEQLVGLMGELLLLRDVFMPAVGGGAAVSAWRGPLGAEQDFVFQFCHVEVKTQVSTEDGFLHIASEHQLDAGEKNLVLCHQTLGPGISVEACSVVRVVEDLQGRLGAVDPTALDRFNGALALFGYEPRPEYDNERWVFTGRTYMGVAGDFPRITPEALRTGVERVGYRIRVSSCQPYRLSESTAMELIFGAP